MDGETLFPLLLNLVQLDSGRDPCLGGRSVVSWWWWPLACRGRTCQSHRVAR